MLSDLGGGIRIDFSRLRMLNEFGRRHVLACFRHTEGNGFDLPEEWENDLSGLINKTDPGDREPAALLDHPGRGRETRS